MRFSIIIPFFNTETYLKRCLDSVLFQSFTDFEVLCVDDGSSDGSVEVLQAYVDKDSRVKLIRNSRKGVSSARNEGLKVATGQYVLFIDSDDWILPGTLRTLNEALIECENVNILIYQVKVYYESTGMIVSGLTQNTATFSSGLDYLEYVSTSRYKGVVGAVCGKVYLRELFIENSLFFCEDLTYNEDVLFFVEVCSHAELVKIISDKFYVYAIREKGSLMTTGDTRRLFDMVYVANSIGERYLNRDDIPLDFFMKTVSSFYRNAILWGGKNNFADLKRHINWKHFKHASSVNWKSTVAYYGIRIAPFFTMSVLSDRCK